MLHSSSEILSPHSDLLCNLVRQKKNATMQTHSKKNANSATFPKDNLQCCILYLGIAHHQILFTFLVTSSRETLNKACRRFACARSIHRARAESTYSAFPLNVFSSLHSRCVGRCAGSQPCGKCLPTAPDCRRTAYVE